MIQRLQLADAPPRPTDLGNSTVVASGAPKRQKWQLRVRILRSHGENPIVQFREGLRKALRWMQERREAQIAAKRLRVCETVSLGEKRFLALVQVDGKQFLVGGAPNSVSMLAALDSQPTFPEMLKEQMREFAK